MQTQQVKGYIVRDMDDTIIDTGILHREYQESILKKYGVTDITREFVSAKYAGVATCVWIPKVLQERNIPHNVNEIEDDVRGKNDYVKTKIESKNIDFMPHAKDALYNLFHQGYRMGIASGSPSETIGAFVKTFELQTFIPTRTSTYDKDMESKPHPSVFINTFNNLERLYGTQPKTDDFAKIVIGDGTNDAEGGIRAGAKAVRVPHPVMRNRIESELLQLQLNGYSPVLIETLHDITPALRK